MRALGQQIALFVIHLGDDRAEGIHGALAGALADDVRGGSETGRASQLDRLLQLGELLIHQEVGLSEPLLLDVAVLNELTQLFDGRGNGGQRVLIRLQKRFVAGDDEAALSGLGVFEEAHRGGQVLQHHVGVRDQIAGVCVSAAMQR